MKSVGRHIDHDGFGDKGSWRMAGEAGEWQGKLANGRRASSSYYVPFYSVLKHFDICRKQEKFKE